MEKRVHFNTAVKFTAGSEQSQRHDVFEGESCSVGKRKIDDMTKHKKSQIEQKKKEESRKRRKVSVYDAVAGNLNRF
jgi:hypothetical protein